MLYATIYYLYEEISFLLSGFRTKFSESKILPYKSVITNCWDHTIFIFVFLYVVYTVYALYVYIYIYIYIDTVYIYIYTHS